MNSFNDIRSISEVLAQPTIHGTPSPFSPDNCLLSEQLYFSTFDEDVYVKETINNYKAQKAMEAWLWKAGFTLLGAVMGACFDPEFDLGDGLNGKEWLDLAGGSLSGVTSANIAVNLLNNLDDKQLAEMNLEWTKKPESFLFHMKSHNGFPHRRLLLISPHPRTSQPCTSFAIQFPDGYVAYLERGVTWLELIRKQWSNVKFDIPLADLFATSGKGFGVNCFHHQTHLGNIQTDNGMELPIELWERSNTSQFVVAIPYSKPHLSIY